MLLNNYFPCVFWTQQGSHSLSSECKFATSKKRSWLQRSSSWLTIKCQTIAERNFLSHCLQHSVRGGKSLYLVKWVVLAVCLTAHNLCWVKLSWDETSWVELSWAESSWVELSRAESNWVELKLKWEELRKVGEKLGRVGNQRNYRILTLKKTSPEERKKKKEEEYRI